MNRFPKTGTAGRVFFFKRKTYAYKRLNVFDGILAVSSRSRSRFFKVPSLIEVADWQSAYTHGLRHPLFHSILEHE